MAGLWPAMAELCQAYGRELAAYIYIYLYFTYAILQVHMQPDQSDFRCGFQMENTASTDFRAMQQFLPNQYFLHQTQVCFPPGQCESARTLLATIYCIAMCKTRSQVDTTLRYGRARREEGGGG